MATIRTLLTWGLALLLAGCVVIPPLTPGDLAERGMQEEGTIVGREMFRIRQANSQFWSGPEE